MTVTPLTGVALAEELSHERELAGNIGEFLRFLARGRRRDSTIRWYAKHLRSLAEMAGPHWEDGRPEPIGDWIACAPAFSTCKGRRRAVGAYLRWRNHPCVAEWLDGRHPAIPRPRGFDPLPIVLTQEQQRALVQVARGSRPRDYAAVLTLLDSGARVGELARVAPRDLAPGSIRLFGKTGPRVVPLGALAAEALIESAGDGDWCFPGKDGTTWVRPKGLANRIARLFRLAGLPEGGAHALRHTFATTYIAGGGSLVRLQRILGHSTVATTERYVHLAARDLGTDHARLSPLAALGAGVQLRLVAG